MAIMPDITLDLLPLGPSYPRMRAYNFLVIHTLVGWAPDGEEAHFTTNAGGRIVQRRDSVFQSAACWNGNPDCLAIENEDHGPAFGKWDVDNGHAVPPFTDEQCESNAEIAAWAHKTHSIPLTLAPNSKPGNRGIAYHRQGCPGNYAGYDFGGIVAGGTQWTRTSGKVCPGDARIHQIIDVIIPRARVLAGLVPAKPKTPIPVPIEEDEVAKTYYAKGKTKPDVWCFSVDGEKLTGRHVALPEWRLALAAKNEAVLLEQADFDALVAAAQEGASS